MTIASGHLDGLLGASFPVAYYGGLAVQSFTASTSLSPVLLTASADATGAAGPLGLGLAGETITIASVDDLDNSIQVVFSYDAGQLPHEFTEYVLGYTAGGLLVSAFDSATVAGLLAGGQDINLEMGIIAAAPVVAGTTTAFSDTGSFTDPVPCFATGTRIATPEGDVAVEDLVAGDQVLTRFAGVTRVHWVGRSRVDCRRHAKPGTVMPVRVRAGAFGPEMPRRDVLLSPGHAVFTQGVLIPVHLLVNGLTVLRETQAGEVAYVHVEVVPHDVLLADGLAAESYLDDGNRAAFADGAVQLTLQVDPAPQTWDDACAPKRESGPEVTAARRRLRARIDELGYRSTDGAFTLWADDVPLLAHLRRGRLHHVTLPAGVGEIRLRSSSGIPADMSDAPGDGRRLGARLSLVLLDGELIPLDSPMLAGGFYGVERNARGGWRWTDGEGVLRLPNSAAPRLLELLVDATMPDWTLPAAAEPEWQAAA